METTSTLCAFILASLAWAQAPSPVREESVYSLPSHVISNDKLDLAVAARGGAMLRLLLQGDPEKLSPFGNPEKLTLNPAPARPRQVLGHFVRVDGFGSVSAEERKGGLSTHGEAHVSPWEIASSGKQGAATTVSFTVKLPLVEEIFTRTITLVDGESVVYLDSEMESLLAFVTALNPARQYLSGMSKIDDVRLEGGKIIAEDRAAGRQVVLAASLPL